MQVDDQMVEFSLWDTAGEIFFSSEGFGEVRRLTIRSRRFRPPTVVIVCRYACHHDLLFC